MPTEEKQSVYGEIERNAYEIANHLKAEIVRMCAERGAPISATAFGVGKILHANLCGSNGRIAAIVPALIQEMEVPEESVRVKRKYTKRKLVSCKACKQEGKIYEAPNQAALMRHYKSEHGTNFGRKGK